MFGLGILKGIAILTTIGGVAFGGSYMYFTSAEEEAKAYQKEKELFEYIINYHPSMINIESVEVLERDAEGLPKWEDSNGNTINIKYKNHVGEKVSGKKKPTNQMTIDMEELNKIQVVQFTPQEEKEYQEAFAKKDMAKCESIIKKSQERNK